VRPFGQPPVSRDDGRRREGESRPVNAHSLVNTYRVVASGKPQEVGVAMAERAGQVACCLGLACTEGPMRSCAV